MKPLTPSDELCIQAYISKGCKNQSAAYRVAFKQAARWKDKTVHNRASEFFGRRDVVGRLAKISQVIQHKTEIDAGYVLKQSVRLYDRCMEESFNASGAAKALKLVGDHVTVQAFKDATVITGPDGGPIKIDTHFTVEWMSPKK